MRKRLSVLDVMLPIHKRLKEAGLPIYEDIDNRKSPVGYIEVGPSQNLDTKTMYKTSYTFLIHLLSPGKSRQQLFGMIREVEELLTDPFTVVGADVHDQTTPSLVTTYREPETKEHHAVVSITLVVNYGFKIKC